MGERKTFQQFSVQTEPARFCLFTLLFSSPHDCVFKGFTAGAVASAHSTLVFLLRGAHHAITAHLLLMKTKEANQNKCSCLTLWHTNTHLK